MKDLVVRRLHVGDPIIPGGVDWPRERCLIVLAKDVKEMTGKTMLYVACFELFFVVKTMLLFGEWRNKMKFHLLSKLALFWILSHLFQNDDEAEIGL